MTEPRGEHIVVLGMRVTVPITQEVRSAYAEHTHSQPYTVLGEAGFDAWLNGVKASVWDDAINAEPGIANPYGKSS